VVLTGVLLAGLTLPLAACTSVEVPSGFPTDEVPLQSTSLSAAERSGDGWNLTVSGTADQLDDALAKLVDAGFVVVGESRSDVGSTYSLATTDYSVRLGVSTDGKDLTYGVVARGATGEQTAPDDAEPTPDDDAAAADQEQAR
jgi:hypothetical protein